MVAKLAGLQSSKYPGLFPAMYPIVGTPDDVVADIERLADLGVTGSTLVFLNYEHELPYFIQEVFPRMEKIGLRAHAVAADTASRAGAEEKPPPMPSPRAGKGKGGGRSRSLA